MTRRSMPSSFKAPCSLWRVFADFFSTYGVAIVGRWQMGTFLFCRQLGTLLGRLVHRGSSGKCGPGFGRIPGRSFRMGWVVESATRNSASKRDAVSLAGLNRKAHSSLRRQNGMRFPHGKIAATAYRVGSVTRSESAWQVRPECPPRSRRRRPPALRARGSPR